MKLIPPIDKPPFKPSRMYKNYPIPYTIIWEKGAERPDFQHIDPRLVKRCLDYSLCGVCGVKIEGSRAWIGSTASDYVNKDGWFSDPPMHIACAEYSARVCPYLLKPRIRPDTPPDTAPDTGNQTRIFIGIGVKRAKNNQMLSRPREFIGYRDS